MIKQPFIKIINFKLGSFQIQDLDATGFGSWLKLGNFVFYCGNCGLSLYNDNNGSGLFFETDLIGLRTDKIKLYREIKN